MGLPATAQLEQPIIELNTTPLIDVMLVLLVMLIVTIPIQTHAVKLDLPGPGSTAVVHPVKNIVVITGSDAILWNGQPVATSALRSNLARTQQMQPIPELHLQPDAAARYETVDQVLAIAKQEKVRKMGFAGNERFRSF
jgi:biopolymer transport protein ExbD